ncbi:MAG: DUF2945 domain-containing protein [Desulfocapsaceae bacterium]|nr:DUF2945 domain-containing protein [Desulfocapsaceae bacterium]
MKFKKGQKVKWSWGDGEAEGKIQKSYTQKVSRTIKGTEVVRNATEDDPAYLIEQEDGDEVLKSESEIEKA